MNTPSRDRILSLLKGKLPVTRFAPSPTGYLHHGHVIHAIYVWGIAKELNAKIILRMEDHDRNRCKPEYESAILEDMEWLGLIPHEGLREEFRKEKCNYRQSDREEISLQQLEILSSDHHLYACDCTRKSLQENLREEEDEIYYPGICRKKNLQLGIGKSLRIQLEETEQTFVDVILGEQVQVPSQQCGDMVIRDNKGNWSYQFCATVDDYLMGVNLVIRGTDLLSSTGRQIQLAKLLGRREMPLFLHHPLIADAQGRKLSKSEFDADIHQLKLSGESAESVIGQAAFMAGWINESIPMTWEEAWVHVR